MTTGPHGDADRGPQEWNEPSAPARRPLGLWVVICLLTAEFVILAVAVVVLVVDLLTVRPTSYASAVALLVLTLLATLWLGAVVLGALRGRAWIRAAAITWQVLQVAVGVGALGGTTAVPGLGWALVVPAVVVVVLLLTPRVVAATARRDDDPPRTY